MKLNSKQQGGYFLLLAVMLIVIISLLSASSAHRLWGGLFANLTVNPGPVTFAGAGAISMGSTAASNFTVTGAGIDLTLSSVGGSVLLSSTENVADAILITTDGGTAETIRVFADQGNTNASIELESDDGGVLVNTAALSATSGLHVEQAGVTAAIQVGNGAPVHSAPQGSIYLRDDGSSTSTRMYINTDSGTTWTNVVTAA